MVGQLFVGYAGSSWILADITKESFRNPWSYIPPYSERHPTISADPAQKSIVEDSLVVDDRPASACNRIKLSGWFPALEASRSVQARVH